MPAILERVSPSPNLVRMKGSEVQGCYREMVSEESMEHVKPIAPDFLGAESKNDNASGREVSVTLSTWETEALLQSLGKIYIP